MKLPLNPSIVVLGIVMSFVLYAQGVKTNAETTLFGRIARACEAKNLDHEECFVRREAIIEREYGRTVRELQARKTLQMVFLIIPCLVLIVSLFVSFAVDRHEYGFALLALAPLFLSFLRLHPYDPEKWMTPFYLLLAAGVALFVKLTKKCLLTSAPRFT